MEVLFNVILEHCVAVFYGLFLFLIWALTRPVYADFRRRKSGYGVIFNALNGEPVSSAIIRFKNPQGQIVSTVVSDKQGRYRLVAPKGEYFVEVVKQGFNLTFNQSVKKIANKFHENILFSKHILTQDYGTITKNIPLVPMRNRKRASFWKHRYGLSKTIQYLIAFLGTGASLYFAIIQNSIIFWIIFIGYLVVMLVRLITFKPPQPSFGTIVDAVSGQPLNQVIVRLFDQRFNKLIETQITSPKGRYAFMVNRGTYRLLIEKTGYRKVIVNFPNIDQEGFLLAKDVKMTKSTR